MSEQHNTVRGIVLRTDDDHLYFIPDKVLESFRVEDPAGRRILRERMSNEPAWHAQSATVERNILMNAAFVF